MPFESQSQRGFMYSQHPKIAERWEKETPSGKLPEHKNQSHLSSEIGPETFHKEVENRMSQLSSYKQQIHTKNGKTITYDIEERSGSYYPVVNGQSVNKQFENAEDALLKAREIAVNYYGP